MPVYQYRGKSRTGSTVSGERNAENKTQLVALLRREQITPTTIKVRGIGFRVKMKLKMEIPGQ